MRCISSSDDEWPTQLNQLSNPPKHLYVLGQNLQEIASEVTETVAIVGARNSTHYGEKISRDFATYFAALGWSVVSGEIGRAHV